MTKDSHEQYLGIKEERTKRLLNEVDGFIIGKLFARRGNGGPGESRAGHIVGSHVGRHDGERRILWSVCRPGDSSLSA